MSDIEQAAHNYCEDEIPAPGVFEAFIAGANYCLKWDDINTGPPKMVSMKVKQSNGNTLIFYKKYLVKGFYNNKSKSVDYFTAALKPGSVSYYFTVPDNFTVTNWRKIELL